MRGALLGAWRLLWRIAALALTAVLIAYCSGRLGDMLR